MLFTKQFLNEQVQKRIIKESVEYFTLRRQPLKEYDIFLSYSFNDAVFASAIVQILENQGFTVYIDLKDPNLDRNDVNRETVERIADMMNQCKALLYIHSQSSKVSKWCPWELGYMSGKKNFRCATIPIINDKEEYQHQEYLKIYPFVDYQYILPSRTLVITVRDISNNMSYIPLKDFINGINPIRKQ